MPVKCFVPGCKSGYDSQKHVEKNKIGMFRPPKGNVEEWDKAIPRKDRSLSCKDVVCEKHFDPGQVIAATIITLSDGRIIEEPLRKKSLAKDAVPHIFPNLPEYLSKKFGKRKGRTVEEKNGEPSLPTSVMSKKKIKDSILQRLQSKLPTPLHKALVDKSQIYVPKNWIISEDKDSITFLHSLSNDVFGVDRSITVNKQENTDHYETTVKFNGKLILSLSSIIRTKEELELCIRRINDLRVCSGIGESGSKHKLCDEVLPVKFPSIGTRCRFCQKGRKQFMKLQRKRANLKLKKGRGVRARINRVQRLRMRVKTLSSEINILKYKTINMEEEAVNRVLDSVTEEKHKEVIKAIIIMASKCKTMKNRRYSNEWMYQCILMRIKSPTLYRKMLSDNILPLPSLRTIQRFIRKLKPQFGFHEATFKLMAKKSPHYSEAERHGGLLVDEMSTEENIEFDKHTGQVHGMVDLGSASPPDANSTLGDHALVFIFQPFKGQWLQAIGAFCSRGAAKGEELEKLVTEAIILLFKHGYYVDVVTTDGGAWNRNVWKLFNITENKVSCINPADSGENEENDESDINLKNERPPRRLWFVSDFPHLVKSIWSRVRTSQILQTPDGFVNLNHWRILVEEDDERYNHIQICHKLTFDHIEPCNWQTMNVQMAFQFFHNDVADAMEYFRDKEKVAGLQDCYATVQFIRRIHGLRKAMDASDIWDSLKYDKENEAYKTITNFLKFLESWKQTINNKDQRLAWQTEFGLQVSLKATLEICAYLKMPPLNFHYLMTKRLNQDPLEHFFGRIRQTCGANSHPDPKQFIQIYRLLSTASLIKPPRGSNVTGGEMLKALTSIADVLTDQDLVRRAAFEEQLDQILDNGDEDAVFENLIFSKDGEYLENVESQGLEHHTYNKNTKINPYSFQMFGGYVARKVRQFSTAKKCDICFDSLSKKNNESIVETQYLIDKRSRGFLLKPSASLYNFLVKIEDVILSVLSKTKMNRHILLEVVDKLQSVDIKSEIGCSSHKKQLTKNVLTWYLNTRMIFACKRHVKTETIIKKRKVKAKNLAKKSKLNAISVERGLSDEVPAQQQMLVSKIHQLEPRLQPAKILQPVGSLRFTVPKAIKVARPNNLAGKRRKVKDEKNVSVKKPKKSDGAV